MNIKEIDWSKSHNGLILCNYEQTKLLMPEIVPIVDDLIDSKNMEYPISQYLIDVKVHMLMPNMFPCIPNWHRDFVPRDKNLNKLPEKITGEKMYLWVSNAPITEFQEKPNIIKCKNTRWVEFTQNDWHRGVASTKHTWRCFIRIIPKHFTPLNQKNMGTIRRHSQVYLSEKFEW